MSKAAIVIDGIGGKPHVLARNEVDVQEYIDTKPNVTRVSSTVKDIRGYCKCEVEVEFEKLFGEVIDGKTNDLE